MGSQKRRITMKALKPLESGTGVIKAKTRRRAKCGRKVGLSV